MKLRYFAHPQALVEAGAMVGPKTRIWAFTHILPGARIGADCNICDHVFVENQVIIGNRVTVKCGVQLWDGIVIADDVFIGPNATFTNDICPRSKHYPEKFLQTRVGVGASIGANATILPGKGIGEWAMIGAGAVITRQVPAHALFTGNPARWRAWICRCGHKLEQWRGKAARCECGRTFRMVGKHEISEVSSER